MPKPYSLLVMAQQGQDGHEDGAAICQFRNGAMLQLTCQQVHTLIDDLKLLAAAMIANATQTQNNS